MTDIRRHPRAFPHPQQSRVKRIGLAILCGAFVLAQNAAHGQESPAGPAAAPLASSTSVPVPGLEGGSAGTLPGGWEPGWLFDPNVGKQSAYSSQIDPDGRIWLVVQGSGVISAVQSRRLAAEPGRIVTARVRVDVTTTPAAEWGGCGLVFYAADGRILGLEHGSHVPAGQAGLSTLRALSPPGTAKVSVAGILWRGGLSRFCDFSLASEPAPSVISGVWARQDQTVRAGEVLNLEIPAVFRNGADRLRDYEVGFVRTDDKDRYALVAAAAFSTAQALKLNLTIPAFLPGGHYLLSVSRPLTALDGMDAIPVTVEPVQYAAARSAKKSPKVPQYPGVATGSGVYVDRAGESHPWYITDTHALIWDGKPYIPIGGMYNSGYFFWTARGQSLASQEGAWRLNVARLDLMKDRGIRDLYTNFTGPAVPPTAMQRWVDALEERKFRYGLEITEGPGETDRVWMPRPSQFRIRVAGDTFDLKLNRKDLVKADEMPSSASFPAGARVRFVFLHERQVIGAAITVASVSGAGDELEASVPVPPAGSAGCDLLYVPELLVSCSTPPHMFAGYAAYEQRVTAWLRQIHFGPGLRFVVDPFMNEQRMVTNFWGASPQFLERSAQLLAIRYGSVPKLNAAWKASPAFDRFEDAAALVPLSGSVAVDAAGVAHILAHGTACFNDDYDILCTIAQEFNSRIAAAVKSVVDVPVIFKHFEPFSPMYVARGKDVRFDGTGWECYGDAKSLVAHNGAVAYAEADLSKRTMWSIVTESSPAAFDEQKRELGYVTREKMYADLDTVMRGGAKGFFTFGFTFDPPSNFLCTELIRDPRELEWMATYQHLLERAGDAFVRYKPSYIYAWPAANPWAEPFTGEAAGIDGATSPRQCFPARWGAWIAPSRGPVPGASCIHGTTRAELLHKAESLPDASTRWLTLAEFRRKVLGLEMRIGPQWCGLYDTRENRALVWPRSGTRSLTANGQSVTLTTPDLTRLDGSSRPAIGYGPYCDTFKVNEAAWIKGRVTHWPDAPIPDAVAVSGVAAEDTNFNLRWEDEYPEVSGEAMLGCRSSVPPVGKVAFSARWSLTVPNDGVYQLQLREQELKSMSPSRWRIDGGAWRDVPPTLAPIDPVRIDYWSAIFSGTTIAWYSYGQSPLKAGHHSVEVQALPDAHGSFEKHIDKLRLVEMKRPAA